MQLLRKWHAAHQQGSSHVGEAHYQFLGLSLYLNSQLPGGGQDQSQGVAHSAHWCLEKFTTSQCMEATTATDLTDGICHKI